MGNSSVLVPAVDGFLTSLRSAMFTLRFGEGGRVLNHPFDVFFCVRSYVDNGPVNVAIQALTRGTTPPARPWPGPVVVLKCADVLRMTGYLHFERADMIDVVEYFSKSTY